MRELPVPTLKDVALKSGVHVGTASRALSGDQYHLVSEATRARVRSVAEELGYSTNAVAQSLRKGTTGALGIVVADLDNSFIVAVIRGIEHESRGRDYMSLVAETQDDPRTLRDVVTRLLRNQVDAIILSAARVTDEEFVSELEQRVPVVLAVRGFTQASESEDDSRHVEVLQDDYVGSRAAANHLMALGHTRIAQLPGPPQIYSFAGRSEGYRAALALHPDVIDVSTGAFALESSLAEGRRLAADLLRLQPALRPTAIFAHNDLMAVGALDALRDAGLRCPVDVSVIGYNDAPLIDHIDPPLTTVRLPGFELGRHSARMAFSLIDGVTPTRSRIMLAPELVDRKSTTPPRQLA
jgi:LacI family transcriptional regulator